MFYDFFLLLKNNDIPVSTKEYLMLLEGLDKEAIGYSVEEFYYLSKSALIKHEHHLDKFDVLFGLYFKGLENIPVDIPLLVPQEGEGEGDGDGEGTGKGKGKGGEEGEGEGGGKGGKAWENRDFKNLDDTIELNTRTLKLALKRLREFTREGIPTELDMPNTIRKTSNNGGYLDLEIVPSKKNRVKVLIFFDIGGSMDPHVELTSRIFSAAKHEFKHLEYYYFHNSLYDYVWKDNNRRHANRIPTYEVFNKYNRDYKVIIVGDAYMSPYEILYPGGSVEHYNAESSKVWLERFKARYRHICWLNPTGERYWHVIESVAILRDIMNYRMFPLTLDGLTQAMRSLKDSKRQYKTEFD